MLTNKEMIIDVLNDYSCQSGYQIKGMVYRKYGVHITPQTAAGVLRPLIKDNFAAKSYNPMNGTTVYWLTDAGKEKFCEK